MRRDDILVRTRSRTPLSSVERLSEAEERLNVAASFFRCHRSFLVNLDHVQALRPRGKDVYELQLAPLVNKWLPLMPEWYRALRKLLKL